MRKPVACCISVKRHYNSVVHIWYNDPPPQN